MSGPAKRCDLPTEGLHLLVLADVADLGFVQNQYYGARREVALSWVVNEQDEQGNYFVIRRTLHASMNERSHLFATITKMYGKRPPKSLDLETLIGKVNNSMIVHTEGKAGTRNAGKKFANIKAFLPAKVGETFAIPKDFVREKDGGKYGRRKTPALKTALTTAHYILLHPSAS